MSEHGLEKLLGGFSADTLTPEEKQALYSASLHDQQLFNALADEQALKELLADPNMRRRLLAALEPKSASGAGRPLSWLNWFTLPEGLAFAGGLTAIVLAVVLGTQIYQDSARQAKQSAATEESTPTVPPPLAPSASPSAPPHVVMPEENVKDNMNQTTGTFRKDGRVDKMAKGKRSLPPATTGERTSDVAPDRLTQRSEQKEVPMKAEAPAAALSKTGEEVTSSTDQNLAARSAPPPAASPPTPMKASPDGTVSAASARALFYGGEPARKDGRVIPQQEAASKSLAESTRRASRLEHKMDPVAPGGQAAGIAAQLKPLGLRYSFVIRNTDGQDREVDGSTAANSTHPVFLTVEANQAAYLQVWTRVGSSTPQLLLPGKTTGQISLRIVAGDQQHIPWPSDKGSVTLTVRLSRVPFGPIIRQEAAMFDRPSSAQLQESIHTSGRPSSQEHATYLINQDSSLRAPIAVDISIGR